MSGRRLRLLVDGAEPEVVRLRAENRALQAEMAAVVAARKREAAAVRRPIPPVKRGKPVETWVRVIVPDTHGSAIDKVAAAAFLEDVRRLEPHEVVCLGDHVDVGGFLAQHHVMGYVAQSAYSYEQDLADAGAFFDALQKAAPRVRVWHYLEGNHERRPETWAMTQTLRHGRDADFLRRQFAPEYQLKLAARGFKYYRQAETYNLGVPGAVRLGKCSFWHGTSTAKHAAAVNAAIFGGNVVYGHTHRRDYSAARPVAGGEYMAASPGCLCQLQPLWRHTAPTSWTHGYGVQLVSRSGNFLHVNVPIVGGVSLLLSLLERRGQAAGD